LRSALRATAACIWQSAKKTDATVALSVRL
jgi:hypothetical protein